MNVLLLGGSGQLGSEIRRSWSGDKIIAPSHAELDITDSDEVARAVDASRAELLVNCAAFHNVDVCEVEPEGAFLYNAAAVDAMANVAQQRSIAFVTISTDYVFDGAKRSPYAESDAPHPLSVYAASKLEGERLVLQRNMKAYVVRTCGIYGPAASKSKGTFIDRVIALARAGESLRIVDDVVVSPTFAGHLADTLRWLADSERYGLYHAVNTGAITWYEYVVEALRQAGIDHPVEPISASQWKTVAVRPSYSALANQKLEALGINLPPWDAGIADYLRVKASCDL